MYIERAALLDCYNLNTLLDVSSHLVHFYLTLRLPNQQIKEKVSTDYRIYRGEQSAAS